MNRTYTATGINLKGMPLGEVDRLVTILTPEYGLIRVVAPGARKYKSQLRGRSELFVVNQLLIAKGRSLDKITQAETIESYPKLSKDLKKLAASQYLAEIVLCLALNEEPQPQLYELLNEHLRRLEQVNNNENIFAYITQGVFHLLAIAGLAPLVHTCCLTQKALVANFQEPKWQVSFSFELGGLVNLSLIPEGNNHHNQPTVRVNAQLGAIELTLLQQLGAKSLPEKRQFLPEELMEINLDNAWIKLERLLRNYAEYHCGQSLRCGALLDSLSKEQF